MLSKIYNNLPVILLFLIVLSIPYLMYKGVKISPQIGYIKDCSGVPVPETNTVPPDAVELPTDQPTTKKYRNLFIFLDFFYRYLL